MPNHILKTAKESEKGVVLLVTILLLSAIMLISFAVATLAQRDVRAAGDMLRGEAALYAADSAIEEVLYRLKNNDETLKEILDVLGVSYMDFDGVGPVQDLDYIVSNVEGETNVRKGNLQADETDQIDIVIDLYDVENEQPFEGETDHTVDQINITWSDADGDNNPAWLEWTLIRWPDKQRLIPFNLSDFEDDPTDLFNSNSDNVTLFKGIESSGSPNPFSIDLTDYLGATDVAADFNYILRLKALYDDITYEVTTSPDSLPGIANIQAVGRRGENKRALEISINQTRGAAGFIDFVLYSDDTIEKF